MIRYDKRGTGLSDWDVADLSFEARVRDLGAIADALGLDHFELLGISEGGATAAVFAARHPERVASLMLYGAYPRLPFRRDLVDVFLHAIRTEWAVGSAAMTAFSVPGDAKSAAWLANFMRASSSGEKAARILETTLAMDVARRDTATSNTDLARSTAIVVSSISDSSSPEPSGAHGDSGTQMPRESREESIPSLKLTAAGFSRAGGRDRHESW